MTGWLGISKCIGDVACGLTSSNVPVILRLPSGGVLTMDVEHVDVVPYGGSLALIVELRDPVPKESPQIPLTPGAEI